MVLTPTELTAIGIALIASVGALLTGVGNLIVALKTTKKVAQVVHSVNSQASAAAAKITALQEEVKSLHQLVYDQRETAALLAQSLATHQSST